jgi:hypothetical protein
MFDPSTLLIVLGFVAVAVLILTIIGVHSNESKTDIRRHER